jgi:hypothetical protein
VVKSNPEHLPLVGSGDNNYATITRVSRLVSKTTGLNEITRGECAQRVQGFYECTETVREVAGYSCVQAAGSTLWKIRYYN